MKETAYDTIQRLITKYHIRPVKSRGQNFLIDEDTYESICTAANIAQGDQVLEIGTGLGTLTRRLSDRGARVITVENDEQLLGLLPKEFPDPEKVKIVPGNILDIPNEDLWQQFRVPGTIKIVANIPYYITGKIIRKFLPDAISRVIVLLVQKEVAERMTATAGDTSMLSLTAQWYGDISVIKAVPRACFHPSPEVDSAVVRIERKKNVPPLPPGTTEEDVFRLARMAFNQKRKKMTNSLSAGLHITTQQASELIERAGVSPHARPQDLGIEQWIKLCTAVMKEGFLNKKN